LNYKTSYHNSDDKVEISEEDFLEGVISIKKANLSLKRYGINKYINLLARNWAQVKYSDQIIAIGTIIKPNHKNAKGYYNKSKYEIVDGGTGYCIQMSIDNNKPVFVFDQVLDKWFRWSYTSLSFIECDIPKITCENFAGVGTREIKQNGINAIESVYNKTFKK